MNAQRKSARRDSHDDSAHVALRRYLAAVEQALQAAELARQAKQDLDRTVAQTGDQEGAPMIRAADSLDSTPPADLARGIVTYRTDPDAEPGDVLPILAKLLVGMRHRRLEREAAARATSKSDTRVGFPNERMEND